MWTPVPQPIFVNYFPPFAAWCHSVIKDNSCLSTIGNNGSECSVGKNTILTRIGDTSITESSYVPTLESETSTDKSLPWSNFVVSMDNDDMITHERISSEGGTVKGSVSVSESKIPVKLENRKAWQSSSEPWDCDVYLH